MAEFTGKKIYIGVKPEEIFTFFDDLGNLGMIMPDQVTVTRSSIRECSFFIKNLGNLGVKKGETVFPNSISFPATENAKVKFRLILDISPENNQHSGAAFRIVADMNPMVEMMVRRPLTNFVDMLADNLAKHFDNRTQ
jgi:hypothetical protein